MENTTNLTVQNNLPAALTEAKLQEFLTVAGIAQNIPANKRKQFIEIAQAYHLNPFKREIYCVGYGETTSIIAGYEVYIKRAERTGKLSGWGVEVSGKGNEMTAKITIHRKDWEHPFTHEVFFTEAAQYKKDGALNAIWKKMPSFMLRKVAIAQGFRLCFSDELGGMPYTADEIPPQEFKFKLAEDYQLNNEDLNLIDCCTNSAELQGVCAQMQKEKGKEYRKAIIEAYNRKKETLNENI